MSKKNGEKPFYLRYKFWTTVMAAGVFLSLALSETVTFTSEEVMVFVLGLAGITAGAHALSDVGHAIARALAERAAPTPPPETAPEPDTDPGS